MKFQLLIPGANVVYQNTLVDTHLNRCQTDAGGLIHGLSHSANDILKFAVNVFNRFSGLL